MKDPYLIMNAAIQVSVRDLREQKLAYSLIHTLISGLGDHLDVSQSPPRSTSHGFEGNGFHEEG
jgi:hypothetical protein